MTNVFYYGVDGTNTVHNSDYFWLPKSISTLMECYSKEALFTAECMSVKLYEFNFVSSGYLEVSGFCQRRNEKIKCHITYENDLIEGICEEQCGSVHINYWYHKGLIHNLAGPAKSFVGRPGSWFVDDWFVRGKPLFKFNHYANNPGYFDYIRKFGRTDDVLEIAIAQNWITADRAKSIRLMDSF